MNTTTSDHGEGHVTDSLLKIDPDVIARLRMSATSVKELVRDGRLASVKIGRSVRVKESVLRSFIAKLGTDATA